MDDEELPMISSSPMLATAPSRKRVDEDENDLSTLKRVLAILDERIASYTSIERLTVEEKDLTIKEQLAMCKSVHAHLQELKVLVSSAINEVQRKGEL